MYKLALSTVAKLEHVNLKEAIVTVRTNPILDNELSIEEELINLGESIAGYRAAANSLSAYPEIRRHIVAERRVIVKHCLGLIIRMIQGRRLPYRYDSDDISRAIRRLVRLIVTDVRKTGISLDGEMVQPLWPFLSLRQKILLYEWRLALRASVGKIPLFGTLPSFRRMRA